MKKNILSSSTVEFFHVLVSPGFEPGTSCNLAERATSRPTGKGKFTEKKLEYIAKRFMQSLPTQAATANTYDIPPTLDCYVKFIWSRIGLH